MSTKKRKTLSPIPVMDFIEAPAASENKAKEDKSVAEPETKDENLTILSAGVAISSEHTDDIIKKAKTSIAKEKHNRGEAVSEEEEYDLRFEEAFSKRQNTIAISHIDNNLFVDATTCLEYGDGTMQSMYIDMLNYLVNKVKPQIKDFSLLRNRELEKLRAKHKEKFDKEEKSNGRKK